MVARISMVFIALGLWVAAPAAAAPAATALAAATSTELDRLQREADFSGVVMIVKDGQPVFARAYGTANRSDNVPNRLDTRFNMASMGKMVTAVAIMQLVEQGKVALDATVGTYLPDYPNAQVRDGVTIAQLLTHTSGLGNFWEQIADKAKERYAAPGDYLPLFAADPLASKPGEQMAYSNNGYLVLGLIIERVTGQSYADYVRDHIYKPAGMTGTDAFRLDAVVPRMATGYARDADHPGELKSNIYVNSYLGGPAGGSYTTAGDLVKFAAALAGNTLLRPDSIRTMTSGKVDFGPRRYAYGFTEETVNGHRIFGHSGGHIGIANELLIFPDLGYVAVILTNGDVDNFWAAQGFIKRRIVGESAETARYDYTLRLIDTVRSKGHDAAVAALAGEHPPVRAGMLEETANKWLWQGDVPQAVALYRLYTEARPDDSTAWLGLGKAQARAGNRAAAAEAWRQYLTLEPEDADIRRKLAALSS
jgi:CubicO group peptidase (beta-lactamase class C family)